MSIEAHAGSPASVRVVRPALRYPSVSRLECGKEGSIQPFIRVSPRLCILIIINNCAVKRGQRNECGVDHWEAHRRSGVGVRLLRCFLPHS